MKGRIKSFNPEKQYGFIVPLGYSEDHDVFFHMKDVFYIWGNVSFERGDPVEFNIINTPKGQHAINVIKGEG